MFSYDKNSQYIISKSDVYLAQYFFFLSTYTLFDTGSTGKNKHSNIFGITNGLFCSLIQMHVCDTSCKALWQVGEVLEDVELYCQGLILYLGSHITMHNNNY